MDDWINLGINYITITIIDSEDIPIRLLRTYSIFERGINISLSKGKNTSYSLFEAIVLFAPIVVLALSFPRVLFPTYTSLSDVPAI
jgi:hypothetical protein